MKQYKTYFLRVVAAWLKGGCFICYNGSRLRVIIFYNLLLVLLQSTGAGLFVAAYTLLRESDRSERAKPFVE